MKNTKLPTACPPVSSRLSWAKLSRSIFVCAVALAGCLVSATVGQAQQVNLLYFPLTNNSATTMPSSTSLGGISVNLTTYGTNNSFGATNLVGLAGSAVNGSVNGASALCLTNFEAPGDALHSANANGAANSAADLGDASLAFGTVDNFAITMWIKLPVVYSDTTGNLLPRLFVLGSGGSPGQNDASLNTLGVKFQVGNQFVFSINNPTTTTGNSYNVPAGSASFSTTFTDFQSNKWYYVSWVYDRTNLYQYIGSDTTVATLQNQFAAGGLSINLSNPSSLVLGNRNWKGVRGLYGQMEDFRFYTNVASSGNNATFVETIRKAIAPKVPLITGVYPDGSSLLQGTNTFSFNATSASGFDITNITLVLNSVDVSSSLTYVTNGTGSTNLNVTYTGLTQQTINTAVITAKDAFGLSSSTTANFDTFSPTNFIVKAEEFDYNGGSFIDNPAYTSVAEGDSYFGLDSTEGIDTHKGGSAGINNDINCYRFTDGFGTRPQTTLSADLPSPTRFGGAIVPSHMVNNWSSGEWQNYTKTYPAGNYNVYARVNTSSGATINVDQVTNGVGTASQGLSRLGSFSYSGNGSFQWVPMKQNGTLAVVNLAGQNTIRITTGGGATANFFMLVPADPNLPVISNVYPDGNYLFEPTNKLVFTVSSAAGINTTNIMLTLNGTNVSAGLVFSGGPNTWTASYTGLGINQTYATVITVTDNNSVSANAALSIDTWNPVLQVEAEDFDFDPANGPFPSYNKRYIDTVSNTPPGVPNINSYEGQVGTLNIDEGGGVSALGHAQYRPADGVATTPVTDLARRQFQNGALDYNVGFLAIGMWQQYTKTYPTGTYNIYARVASGANQGTYYSSLSQVLAGWGSVNQVIQHIGSFAVPTTGGYSAYFYAPLIDRFGNYAQMSFNGTNTLRVRQIVNNQTETPALQNNLGGININFYMLVAPRTDLPRVDSVYPNGFTPMQQTNTFAFVASNPTYGITTNNIVLTLNGVNITNLVFSGSSASWNVSYPGLQPNTNYTAVITITDNNGQMHTTTVSFDTFSPNDYTWEAEDFDFDPANSPISNGSGLRFIDNPTLTSSNYANSYYGQTGDLDVDYSTLFTTVSPVPAVYRTSALNVNNVIPIEVTAENLRPAYLNAQLAQVNPNVLDYDIFDLTNTAWINYTRTFPTGNFNVYANMAVGTGQVNVQCAQVIGGSTNALGYFRATGDNYVTWQSAELINTNTGAPIVLALGGVKTLEITGTGAERINYYILVPVLPNVANITATRSGANVNLAFPTQSGYTYTVYYKNNLTDPTWTLLPGGGNPVTGNGTIQSVTDSLGGGSSHRFYRLQIQ